MKNIIAVLFTWFQLQDQHCKDYCRWVLGYDSGLYVEVSKSCWCANRANQESMKEKKLKLPKKHKPLKEYKYEKEPQEETPYKLPFD